MGMMFGGGVGLWALLFGGLVVVTLGGMFMRGLGRRRVDGDRTMEHRFSLMEQKIQTLESKLLERDAKIDKLENEISFINRLLEDKSG